MQSYYIKNLICLYLKFLPYHSNFKINQRQETIIIRSPNQRGESSQNKQSSAVETMDPLRANNDRKSPNNLVNRPPTHAINQHWTNFQKETRWERVNHRRGKKEKNTKRDKLSFKKGRCFGRLTCLAIVKKWKVLGWTVVQLLPCRAC